MTTPTLTDFLLARIAEDADAAHRAAFGWGAEWSSVDDGDGSWSTVHADGKRDMVGCEDGDVTQHIALHDPARVLAECESKRRIRAEHPQFVSEGMSYCETCERSTSPCPTLRILALPYAEHADYRPEWRP